MELADSLKAIANAIRSKTGKTEKMTIDQMSDELNNISHCRSYIARYGCNYLFYYNQDIKTLSSEDIAYLDTSSVTDMGSMFGNCSNLTSVPSFNTSSVTNMSYMFNNCSSLTSVPLFNTTSVTDMCSMFNNCSSLTEVWLRNIKKNLQVGSGTKYGHLLTVESLLHLIKELVNVGSSRTLTIGTVNLRKLANTYVKLIDITDEMRAEDELVDQKLPFEVCESTDEGAMLISDYTLSKLWTIK